MYSEDLLHWIEEFVFYEIRRITRTANLLLSVRRGCLCSKRCLLWVIQIGFTSHGDRIYTPIGIISISRRWRLFHRKGLSLSPLVGGGYICDGWRIWRMFLEFSRVYAGTFGAAKVPAYTREGFAETICHPSSVTQEGSENVWDILVPWAINISQGTKIQNKIGN